MAVPELPAESGWYRLTAHGWEPVPDDVAKAEADTPGRGYDLVHVNITASMDSLF